MAVGSNSDKPIIDLHSVIHSLNDFRWTQNRLAVRDVREPQWITNALRWT